MAGVGGAGAERAGTCFVLDFLLISFENENTNVTAVSEKT